MLKRLSHVGTENIILKPKEENMDLLKKKKTEKEKILNIWLKNHIKQCFSKSDRKTYGNI